jgi:hypothetical protein
MPLDEPNITWWVTFEPDYPSANGLMHVYCANADVENTPIGSRFDVIPNTEHPADNCFIDHSSRLGDIEIPEEMKSKLKLQYWMYRKFNP